MPLDKELHKKNNINIESPLGNDLLVIFPKTKKIIFKLNYIDSICK